LREAEVSSKQPSMEFASICPYIAKARPGKRWPLTGCPAAWSGC
jgi:hypothetical protein